MDSRELTEWQVYESLEGPIGPPRTDFNSAVLASVMANLWAKGEYKPADFMPKWGPEDAPDPEDLQAKWEGIVKMWGSS